MGKMTYYLRWAPLDAALQPFVSDRFIAVVASSLRCMAFAEQSGGDEEPPEQAQGEQKSTTRPLTTRRRPNRLRSRKLRRRSRNIKQAAAKLSSSAGAPECVWTDGGSSACLARRHRHGSVRYIDLCTDRFDCSSRPEARVRCVIEQGQRSMKAADRLAYPALSTTAESPHKETPRHRANPLSARQQKREQSRTHKGLAKEPQASLRSRPKGDRGRPTFQS